MGLKTFFAEADGCWEGMAQPGARCLAPGGWLAGLPAAGRVSGGGARTQRNPGRCSRGAVASTICL
jgi:hypothetical protein